MASVVATGAPAVARCHDEGMIEILAIVVIGLLVIAGAHQIGARAGVAPPLVLLLVGIAASFLPALADFRLDPELVLQGLLPPLLYAAAVSMPTMTFRREFRPIAGLSVVLVVASSLALGGFFVLVLPDIGFAWGVALGAIISPTDAVATSIVKRTPVAGRVIALLDGESLLNDATALVLLRTAIVATAATFSFWGAVGTFAYSVAIAVAIGLAVGWANLLVRRRVVDPTVSTVVSFTVPFLAAVPAELLEASGLVAAVVAGLVTGTQAPRWFSAQTRLSDTQNWRMIEMTLEGAVFLTMGLQVRPIVATVQAEHLGVAPALLVAVGALALALIVRALYVTGLLRTLRRRARRGERLQTRLYRMRETMTTPEGSHQVVSSLTRRESPSDRQVERVSTRVTRGLASLDYFLTQPLGWREGVAVVWAGMRGAITLAAAQTLPPDTPDRPVLILIAFAVALVSLLVQGSTVGPLLRWITPPPGPETLAAEEEERRRLYRLMRSASEGITARELPDGAGRAEQFAAAKEHRLAALAAQRAALLEARDDGVFDADLRERARQPGRRRDRRPGAGPRAGLSGRGPGLGWVDGSHAHGQRQHRHRRGHTGGGVCAGERSDADVAVEPREQGCRGFVGSGDARRGRVRRGEREGRERLAHPVPGHRRRPGFAVRVRRRGVGCQGAAAADRRGRVGVPPRTDRGRHPRHRDLDGPPSLAGLAGRRRRPPAHRRLVLRRLPARQHRAHPAPAPRGSGSLRPADGQGSP